MSSLELECYENLRRDFKHILSEDNNLVEEDEALLDSLLACSINPDNVLEFARGLKEDGNAYFKEGKIDEALEYYGYAGVALVRCNFEKDGDKVKCVDLVISLLLNFAACLGKKNEFNHVGQVCSIVLEYMPNNVKALFRRAKAAKALGRSDLAYWDLIRAANIDPKNSEVKAAVEEIKNVHAKEEKGNGNQGRVPIGLGLSLPLSKKKYTRLQKEDQVESQSKLCGSAKANIVEICDEETNMKENQGSGKEAGALISSTVEEENTIGVNRPLEDSCSHHSSMSFSTNVSHNSIVVDDSNLAGPKYRFYNRKRRGSSFTISKSDYNLMAQGKTLMFYNTKVGSFMQARVVQKPNENSTIVQEKNQKVKDVVQPGETSLQRDSCMKSEDNQAAFINSSDSPIEEDNCSSNLAPHFLFATKSASTERKRIVARSNCLPQFQGSSKRRKRMPVNICPSPPSTKVVCGCRFEAGTKRKFAHPYALVFCNRPRKRLSSLGCNSKVEVDDSCFDCNGCYLGNDSVLGYVTYEMAHGQSNRFV